MTDYPSYLDDTNPLQVDENGNALPLLQQVRSDPPQPARRFYTPAEIAELFGVTRRTVYFWIRGGHLPALKLGPKIWQITQPQLDTFLRASERSARPSQQPEQSKRTNLQQSLPVEMLPVGSGKLAPINKVNKSKDNKRRL